jgi:putative redox protein
MQFKKLFFRGADGQKLAARLDSPEDAEPAAHAVFAHCFTCTKNIKAAANISQALTRQGIAVFRFDFTGLGESEGDFADTNFSSNVEDLIAAAEYLKSNFTAPKILVGHSLGGAAVLQAALDLPSVTAVVTIAAPSSPEHLSRHLVSIEDRIEKQGEAEVLIEGRRFTIKRQFLEDLKGNHMDRTVKSLDRALLVLHSPLDEIVAVENAGEIFAAARHPKSFVSLDRADHLLSDRKDSIYAGNLIAVWASRYI